MQWRDCLRFSYQWQPGHGKSLLSGVPRERGGGGGRGEGGGVLRYNSDVELRMPFLGLKFEDFCRVINFGVDFSGVKILVRTFFGVGRKV